MKIKQVNISDLKLSEENVRMHPTKQIDEYVRSLEMFGQIKNAVVDEDYRVLVGNGLILALQKMGIEKVSVLIKTDLSDNEKKKLMMSDNKVFSLGVDNLNVLDKFINDLIGDLNIPGFDEETLNSMVATAESVTNDILEYGKLDVEKINDIRSTPEPTRVVSKNEILQEDNSELEELEEEELETEKTNIESNLDNIKVTTCVKCGEEIWLSKEFLRQLM